MIAIADTCFLVNWLRYRRRNDIFKLYKSLAIPFIVLDELSFHRGLLADWISSRKVFFIPRINRYDIEALNLVEYSHTKNIPHIDSGEAYCLAVARNRDYDVLTDNIATKFITRDLEEYSIVKVLDSLDILYELYGNSIKI